MLSCSVTPERFNLSLLSRFMSPLSLFAKVELLLAAIGIYGLTAYTAMHRTLEIAAERGARAGARCFN